MREITTWSETIGRDAVRALQGGLFCDHEFRTSRQTACRPVRELPLYADDGVGSGIDFLLVPTLGHGSQFSEIPAASCAALLGIPSVARQSERFSRVILRYVRKVTNHACYHA